MLQHFLDWWLKHDCLLLQRCCVETLANLSNTVASNKMLGKKFEQKQYIHSNVGQTFSNMGAKRSNIVQTTNVVH